MSEIKVWYESITLWTNVITLAVWLLATFAGIQVPAPVGASVLAILNVLLVAPGLAPTSEVARQRNLRGERSRSL